MDETKRRQVFQAAYRSYRDKAPNKVIAAELKVSATQVARLLQDAEAAGIVKFTLDPPRLQTLEATLTRSYPCLREAVVVPTSKHDEFQLEILGSAAAHYFDHYVDTSPTARIAIGAGTSVDAMIKALERRDRKNLEIYPTRLIGMGPTISEIHDVQVHICLLWDKSGRRPGAAHYVTMLPQYKELANDKYFEIHRQHQPINLVHQAMREVDCVITSVGPVLEGAAAESVRIRLADIGLSEDKLRDLGVAGEISYSFFDRNGEKIPELEKFFNLGVDHLKRMSESYPSQRVVLIAAGQNKVAPLRAALKGRLLNVLITDESTAESLTT